MISVKAKRISIEVVLTVDEHANEAVQEEPHAGDLPAIGGLIPARVEGAVEGNGCQVGVPDGLRRIYKETAG